MNKSAVTPYPRIMSALFAQPWEMLPETHAAVCDTLFRVIDQGGPGMAQPAEFFKSGPDMSRFENAVEISQDGRIAVLTIDGMLGYKMSALETACGAVDLVHVNRHIERLQQDSRIQTVIFSLETPGGMARPSSETAKLISELGETKRTVAYSDGLCASAGYKLMSACQEAYASKSASLGCVGTYIALVDSSKKWEKDGLQLQLFRDGKYKALGYPGKAMTDDEKEFLEGEVTGLSAKFKDFVKSRRPKIDPKALEGQCLSGTKAKNAGLVDGFYRDLDALVAAEIKR